MQMRWSNRRPVLVLIALLAVLSSMPGWAQRAQREVSLNGVTLNSSFLDVMQRLGPPHYVGPSFFSAEEIKLRIDPPPPNPMGAMGMPAFTGMPGVPGMPGMMSGPGGAQVPQVNTKPPDDYVIWKYEGGGPTPNPNAGWQTYVFFNRRGIVASVMVTAKDASVNTGVVTSSGAKIGTRMMDLVSKYDWPEPFTSVAGQFYCSYPDRNITFALDPKSRRVTTITLGAPMTITGLMNEQGTSMTGAPTGIAPVMGLPPGMPPGSIAPPGGRY